MLLSYNGIVLLIWICVFTVVCTLILGCRFWAARIVKRGPAPDDYMVVFAFANTIALEGCAIWAICNGLGAHTTELSKDQLAVQFKLIVASGITWLLATVALKLSLLWLYVRIFATAKFRRWAYAAMALVGCYGVAFLCVFLTNCQPISQQWAPVAGGWCRDISVEELASVALNLVIDLMVVIMPMPVLWSLQMATRNKIFISMMFSLGFLTVGIMAWRIQVTLQANVQVDFVYGFSTVALISFLELWLGLIVACMPTLAPLSNQYIKPHLSRLGTTRRSKKYAGDYVNLRKVNGVKVKQSNGSSMLSRTGKTARSADAELDQFELRTTAEGTDAAPDAQWTSHPNGIWMQRSVQVDVGARAV